MEPSGIKNLRFSHYAESFTQQFGMDSELSLEELEPRQPLRLLFRHLMTAVVDDRVEDFRFTAEADMLIGSWIG
jgi:hypothetical protein